jgi:Tol biopolymer transport system component
LLRKLLRGDLDLIVMKTLEKDRTRRYERAVELAADVERHLNNKPVLAAPPSITYRLRKFVRRNRVAVITASLVAAALAIGAVATTLTYLTSDRLTVRVEQATPNYRLVLDEQIAGMPIDECDFSPNGDRIVFRTDDNLYITDQTATTIRPFLDDLGPWETTVSQPRWSPDGQLIVYALTRKPMPGEDAKIISAIFILNPDGGAPRQVGPDMKNQTIYWLFWTPDGQHLTYRIRGGFRTITLDGNEVSVVRPILRRSSGSIQPGERLWSPYGSWLLTARMKDDWNGKDLYIVPFTGGGEARRLTDLPGYNISPTWAPDGRTLYFVSGTEDKSNIWKLPMDPERGVAKGEPQQVTFFKDTIVMAPKVLGDGSRIGFGMRKYNTYLQVADSSSPDESRSLVPCARYSPELSPDGQTIYYVNDTPGEEGIYAVPRDGGASRRLTESLTFEAYGAYYCRRFDLSPDGRTLAYSNKISDRQVLFTIPASGGEQRLLAQLANAGKFGLPQWSPDGSQLAYADGNDLCVIPATGGEPRELAHMSQGWWEPYSVRWSPDGKFIAAFGIRDRKSMDVFAVPASGGELRQLPSAEAGFKEGLEWHPDGRRLTHHVTRPDSATYQAYLDGRQPTMLVNAPDVWDYVGTWAPDGRRFFFIGQILNKNAGMLVYDESSGETTQVLEPGESAGVPGFSRDGETMAWWQTRQTGIQAWIMEDFPAESTAGK